MLAPHRAQADNAYFHHRRPDSPLPAKLLHFRNRLAPATITCMSQGEVLELGRQAMLVGLQVALPILIAALIVGLMVSVFQAVTQIQEMTLQFIPKMIAVGLVVLFAGGWMLTQMVEFTVRVFTNLPPR
jgi:flagellar biosynthetic protein FliQ